ncbi:MAG: serine/threonine-protein kinase [Phycisphaerales bacterium]
MPEDRSRNAASKMREAAARPDGVAALFYSSIVDADSVELPQPQLPYRVGVMLGDGHARYELVAPIGKGRQAVVYRAIDRQLSDAHTTIEVAVKLFPARAAGRSDQALTEGRLTRLASDPNVVTVLDAGTTPERWPFLVLQIVDAIDLQSWRKERGERIDPRTAVSIARDVARGISAIARANLVHYDVSPRNILVDRQGRAIVADFGCAVRASSTSDEALGFGTPAFMPAEQRAGAVPDHRADVAGLGGVLYWLLTGSAPYGESWEAIEAAHADPEAADARRRRALATAGIDPALTNLVRSMLAANPEARPTSEQVDTSLSDWLAQARRVRKRTIAAVLAATVMLTAIVAWVIFMRTAPAQVTTFGTEDDAVASALGVAPTDPRYLVLSSRQFTADARQPSAEEAAEVLHWMDGRFDDILWQPPIARYAVATLVASLALEYGQLETADRWLPVSEQALESTEFAPLLGTDSVWMRRQLGLVAVAHLVRRSRESAAMGDPDAPLPSGVGIVEPMRLRDWLRGGATVWRHAPHVDSPTSRMMAHWRERLDTAYRLSASD